MTPVDFGDLFMKTAMANTKPTEEASSLTEQHSVIYYLCSWHFHQHLHNFGHRGLLVCVGQSYFNISPPFGHIILTNDNVVRSSFYHKCAVLVVLSISSLCFHQLLTKYCELKKTTAGWIIR